jgi:small subunit ribosomal protein S21
VVIAVPGIVVHQGEDFESAYRKFKRQVDRNLIVVELRKRRFYEPPSERKKKEKIATRKKILRKLWMLRRYESRL